MNETFRGRWSKLDECDINKVSDLILTGTTAKEAEASTWLPNFLGDEDKPITLLDFGCGFGRNTIWLAKTFPQWTVVGYDSEQMLKRVPEYAFIKYDGKLPNNVWFVSNWEQVRMHKFDKMMCVLVLQHIHGPDLANYLKDFKNITSFLLVHGRRYNDGKGQRSTWAILEENGYLPDKFYSGHEDAPYIADGDPSEHNSAKYFF